jgi:hypothetical protein
MKNEFRNVLKPLILDENVLLVAVYQIDGTPIFVESKKTKGILDVIYWLERQIQGLIYYIYSAQLSDAEFRFRDYYVVLYPISRSLVLGILATLDVSAYKLRVDLTSIREILRKRISEESGYGI